MSKSSYRLSNQAREDVIRIYQYGVLNFGSTQAEIYYNKIFDCFNSISSRPFSFTSVDHIKTDYRRCVCGVDSIYFKVLDNEVLIMTIVGRQEAEGVLRKVIL